MSKPARLLALILALTALVGASADVMITPEELLAGMTLRQKVGQLFLVRPECIVPRPQRTAGDRLVVNDSLRERYADYPVGGFVMFSANIASPAQLKAYMCDLEALNPIPPIFCVDEEGGPVLRIASNASFGLEKVSNMRKIGDTGDTENARTAGAYLGGYLHRLGFNLDLAPVADARTNPGSIVIGNRSFGKDPERVSDMVAALIGGLHEAGVGACIKHFPGHGGVSGDSHKGFVVLDKTWDELRSADLIPFVDNLGIADVVMVGHISVPRITDDNLPASLSRQLIEGKLRGELGYEGLITTDSLEMGAIANNYESDIAAPLAVYAGVDLLMMPANLSRAFDAVVAAVESGRIPQSRIDESVLRILRFKLASKLRG